MKNRLIGILGLFAWIATASCLALDGFDGGPCVFEVTDEAGAPVSKAEGTVWFVKDDNLHSIKPKRGTTDEKGMLSVSGHSAGEIIFQFRREGYYLTRGRLLALPAHAEAGSQGQPNDLYGQDFRVPRKTDGDGPETGCTIVMKRILDPHPMQELTPVLWQVPPDANPGFDLEAGDWVAPFGAGQTADVRFVWNDGNPWLLFGDADSGNGCICLNNDFWSERGQVQTAPREGYRADLDLGGSCETRNKLARGHQYLVVRFRARKDAEGNIVSARYGVITRLQSSKAWHVPDAVRHEFAGWMNMEDNELGLENQ